MMGKIMKRNDFGKIVNYTMKGNNKSNQVVNALNL